ncbi:MAG TPA: carboxylating nicotinate-nucleotide diphosphorylase [Kiritimatiellia bacterium]|nr:carboxylating nicotinate-nucleotide diphosphorylase [Kiritimatiellia bacterium]
MDFLKPSEYEELLKVGLREDAPTGDITTMSLFDESATGEAALVAKQDGVLAGIDVAAHVFSMLDPTFDFEASYRDGARLKPGVVIAKLKGKTRALLTGERLALNLLQRMSGIATLAAAYVEAVAGLPVRILDTRKTPPGLRVLDKYAVRAGGAYNHRMTLSDLAMVKDNHLQLAGGITAAVSQLKRACPGVRIEVETETLDHVREALNAGADIIMLDNMPIELMRQAVKLIGGACTTEASGNVRLDTVRSIAETGVDFISVGELTHSVRALDISLKSGYI